MHPGLVLRNYSHEETVINLHDVSFSNGRVDDQLFTKVVCALLTYHLASRDLGWETTTVGPAVRVGTLLIKIFVIVHQLQRILFLFDSGFEYLHL